MQPMCFKPSPRSLRTKYIAFRNRLILTNLLDPRELASPSVHGAVNIPLSMLASRVYELPPPGSQLRVADVGEVALQAITELLRLNRRATVESHFAFAESLPHRLWRPNPLIEQFLESEPPGNALDLGCGTGRDAVELASRGWQVTAIDHLPDALEKGRQLASRYGLSVAFQRRNVGVDNLPDEAYDLVMMLMFLNREGVQQAASNLAHGGILLLECYSDVNVEHFGKPGSKALSLGKREVLDLLPGFEVIHHSEDWRSDSRHTVQFVGRRVG